MAGGRIHCPLCHSRSMFIQPLPAVNGHERKQAECLQPECEFFQIAARKLDDGTCITLDGLDDRPAPAKRPALEVRLERERSPQAVANRLRDVWDQHKGLPLKERVKAVVEALDPGERFNLREVFTGKAAADAQSEARRQVQSRPELTYTKGNRWGPARISRHENAGSRQQPEQRSDRPLQNSQHAECGEDPQRLGRTARDDARQDHDPGGVRVERSSARAVEPAASSSCEGQADAEDVDDPPNNVGIERSISHVEYMQCLGALVSAWHWRERMEQAVAVIEELIGDDHCWLTETVHNCDLESDPMTKLDALLVELNVKVEECQEVRR